MHSFELTNFTRLRSRVSYFSLSSSINIMFKSHTTILFTRTIRQAAHEATATEEVRGPEAVQPAPPPSTSCAVPGHHARGVEKFRQVSR